MIMQHTDYFSIAGKAMKKIENGGAFLTVQAGGALNVMTIGWASLGFIWGRPIMTVLVRPSRHSFGIIERAAEFTVSVPAAGMKKELEFCGTQSGRKVDKIRECRFEMLPGEKVSVPVLNIVGAHFECRIVYKSPINPALLIESYGHLYPGKDHHTLYFGEIVYCYSIKSNKRK
ncbi:MAG: flavin reductase family protein [Chitinispirillaceae bacterium]|nr:flavin reductase family protein [Chitinispirillaceae bacterium]